MLPLRDVIPSRTTPWVTLALIAVNGLVFVYGWLLPSDVLLDVLTRYSLVPVSATFATATSAMFFHENLLHAGSNLVALWLFGENVEDRLGHGRYLTLYLAAGYAGTLAELWATPASVVPLVGASGAIAGVIGAYVALFPRSRVLVLIPTDLVEVPAVAFVACWFVLQIAGGLGQLSAPDTISMALWTPLGGCLAGLLLARLLRRPERARVEWWS